MRISLFVCPSVVATVANVLLNKLSDIIEVQELVVISFLVQLYICVTDILGEWQIYLTYRFYTTPIHIHLNFTSLESPASPRYDYSCRRVANWCSLH